MSIQFQRRHRVWFVVGFLLLGITIASTIALGQAHPVGATDASSATLSNDACMSCHGEPGMTLNLESGEVLWLSIDANKFTNSVHNLEEVGCVDCHTDITSFPHPERTGQSIRELSLDMYTSCKECHDEQYGKTLDSVHERALAGGNPNAAVCTDCHNPHTQERMTHPVTGELLLLQEVKIPETCGRCHNTIYETYRNSVHGDALIGNYNQDVPTCIDCHGVHDISDPTTTSFRLDSPQTCASCHTDSEVMDKYGVSTNVLDTYVADFHGATVELFEKRSPDHDTNKPVCYDCHGIHDIKAPDDPEHGIAIKENLLITCQRCHPEADANFPDSWMSHYEPDAEHYPVVFYVDWFYKIVIPVTIGGMLAFVISDIVRRLIDKRKGASHS